MESGAVSTAASTLSSARVAAIRRRFSFAVAPVKVVLCATTGAMGGGGWLRHTASTGLSAAATSRDPAFAQAARRCATWSGVCSQGS